MNPQYPKGENGTDTCQVTIEKANNVCQLRLDFEDFILAQPDENGLCTTDSFMVRTTVGERLPILCGENSGQHSKYSLIISCIIYGDLFNYALEHLKLITYEFIQNIYNINSVHRHGSWERKSGCLVCG